MASRTSILRRYPIVTKTAPSTSDSGEAGTVQTKTSRYEGICPVA